MFAENSIDAQILAAIDVQLARAEEEILGGDLLDGTLTKKALLRNVVDLCEKNNDEEQLSVYRNRYAADFPKEFEDPIKLNKFKHLR